MFEQELQTYNVSKDTMTKTWSDLNELYYKKVQTSQNLSDLNHSKLMMEVRWLLLKHTFDP